MADNTWAADINGDEDEDEALRIAIAMSLGRDPGEREDRPTAKARVVDLTQDSDEGSTTDSGDDLVEVDGGAGSSKPASNSNNPPAPAPPAETSTLSALGLDRKKMEEERLARLSKRKAAELGEGVQPPSRPSQRPKTEDAPPLPSAAAALAKKQTTHPAKPTMAPPSSPSATQLSSSSTPHQPPLPFPQGTIKKTWAYGQPRHGDDIKIEEVLQKQQLQLAVLSSFQWDEEWLLSRVDLARTKLVLVAFASDERQVRLSSSFFLGLGWSRGRVSLLMVGLSRKRRCAAMCPATGSGSVSRPWGPWGPCTPS